MKSCKVKSYIIAHIYIYKEWTRIAFGKIMHAFTDFHKKKKVKNLVVIKLNNQCY